jgi:hypothetical protein
MKYLRYVALFALLALPLAYSQGEVRVGVGVGFGGYVVGPPVCAYGYYPDYPYGCAPYGYYGPSWFVDGIFIGAGPWYHGWGHPYYGRYYGRDFDDRFEGRRFERHGFEERGFDRHGFEGRRRAVRGGFEGRGRGEGFHGGFRGRR